MSRRVKWSESVKYVVCQIQFDPDKYLEGFYKSAREDVAMQIVLFFMPGMVCRLPRDIGTMLDLGAGGRKIQITFRNDKIL